MKFLASTAARGARWVHVACLAGVVLGRAAPPPTIRLVGETRLVAAASLADVRVGGLSGLDFDPRRGDFVAVSDDRSAPRVFRLQVDWPDAGAVRARARATAMIPLPAPGQPRNLVDCESIRVDPSGAGWWIASEGDAALGVQPAVWRVAEDGRQLDSARLPEEISFKPRTAAGVRPNQAIEGMAFAPGGGALWVALEAPLREDGPVATSALGAWVRFFELAPDGRILRRVVYPVDAIPGPVPAGRLADNGVAEILALDRDSLLVLERAGVQHEDGGFRFHVRLYHAVLPAAGLVPPGGSARASKTLVADLNLMLPQVDNLEGMALGPRRPDGWVPLVLVADDNFSPDQSNQVVVLEILPP